MARLQILELPEGTGDDRPPFVLVIDQYEPLDVGPTLLREPIPQRYQSIAERVGARAVLAFEETIDIPANEVSVDPDGYPLKLRIEPDFETFREQVQDEILAAQGEVTRALRATDVDHDYLASAVQDALGITPGDGPPDVVGWLLTACRELKKSEAARHRLSEERADARNWARHGYEIGQKHCGWTDHGIAPDWLTEGWPPHIESCEHLKKAAEYDEALSRVRALPEQPPVMDAQHPDPSSYLHGYGVAIREAKRATWNQPASAEE